MTAYRAKPPKGALLNRADPLAKGLAGAWLLNEGSGLTIYDSAGKNNGTLTNGPTWASGPSGRCLSFDAVDDVADCGTPAGLNSAAKASYAAWIYKASAASGTAGLGGSGGGSGGGNRFSVIWYSDGNAYFAAEAVGGAGYGFCAVASGWHRLLCAYDGTQAGNAARLQVYIDGVPQSLSFFGTIPAALGSAVGPWTLGKDSSDRFCGGILDSVLLWTGRALAAADAQRDYADSFRMFRRRTRLAASAAASASKPPAKLVQGNLYSPSLYVG